MTKTITYRGRVRLFDKIHPTVYEHFGPEYQVGHEEIVRPDLLVARDSTIDVLKFPGLWAVGRAGIGVDKINVGEASRAGIAVFNTPGGNAPAVSELLFTALGVFARNVDKALHIVRTTTAENEQDLKEKLKAAKKGLAGFELRGKTLGIIGLGHIGRQVAEDALKRGMAIIGFDPYASLSSMHQLDRSVRVAKQMEQVLQSADILTVHVPLSHKTRGLIGKDQIALMKEGSIVVNYARETICDDTAIIEALDAGHLQAYISDFPTEQIRKHTKVFCTPHLGASTEEAEETCASMIAAQLKEFLELGSITNSVNFPQTELVLHPSTRARLVVINNDRPNMISMITGRLGDYGHNINKSINESNGNVGFNLIDLDVDVPDTVQGEIRKIPDVRRVRVIRFPKAA